jgi:uncharacterized protein (DUF885 family)
MRLYSLACLALLGLTARAQAPSNFFKDTFEQMLRDDPEFATSAGRHEYDDRWTDWSKAGRDNRYRFLQQKLSALETADVGDSAQNLLTKRIVRYDFQTRIEAWQFDIHLLRVGQLFGFHNNVYDVIDQMPANNVHDYENILARLRTVPGYVDQNIGILDEAIASGIMQPRVVAEAVIGQIDEQSHQTSEQTQLLKAFRAFPAAIPAAEQQRLRAAALDAYTSRFLPAWRKLHDYMVASYLPKVRPGDSISTMPGGRDAYTTLIHEQTSTTMSPAEIHKLGEQEVARIEAAMQATLKDAGFTGTASEFRAKIMNDPAQHYKSKDEMLADARNILMTIEPELPKQFRHIPALLFGVRPIPPDREAATATNAEFQSPDLTKPGWYNLNTYQPEQQVRFTKESLALHEALPGHIYQGAIAYQEDLPDLRRFYYNNAYIEGWALYAESLGSGLGLYKSPYSRFGQLNSELFRAVRLVVDTGIHDLGWTRQQALDYFKIHAPDSSSAEIDRYISWPGQALGYKLGELRIRELREKAQKQLGAKFDIRDFNDAIIRDSTLPLDILTEQIDQFIARTR